MSLPEKTVADLFRHCVARHGSRHFLQVLPETASIHGVNARHYTYDEAAQSIVEYQAAYAAAGYGHGHRVGLQLENRPDYFFHWFALNALGVAVVPMHADWREEELAYLMVHSEIALVVGLAAKQAALTRAIVRAGVPVEFAAIEDFRLSPQKQAAPLAHRAPGVETECALLYTSGTTGRPKGCVLSNEYFLTAANWYASLGGHCELRTGEERLITPLPLSHVNAMAFSSLAMVRTGGCLIQLDRFHSSTWWSSVRESRATIFHYLGVMPAMLLSAPPSSGDRRHAVRFGFGAGVGRELHAPFESRFGIPLIEAWSMTETGAGAVIIANHEPRKVGTSCIGKPSADLVCRIVDEAGCAVEPGKPGELLVHSAGDQRRRGFFSEYLKDEQATDDAWRDGSFHTGDIVYADDDGDIHFIDRRRNVIRRSGENISAVEVESVLLRHEAVAAVGIAAVPDALRGDEVMACVVAKEAPLTPEAQQSLAAQLVSFCLEALAYFKAPGYIAFCEQLPLTPTQKIQRALLQQLAVRLLEGNSYVDTRHLKRRPS